MDINNLSVLRNLENLHKIKQREVFCPMAKTRALVSPLMTIDDLSLRTTIASPDLYDQEISHLLWKRIKWPDITGDISFDDFISNSSYIDRKILIWGLFASTYGTLGNKTIECPHCENKFEDEVTAEQIIQEDSITIWEEEVSFNEFIYSIEYKPPVHIEGIYKIIFKTSIPTIKNHLDVLKLIPIEKIKENYQKFGNILSRSEELASVTREITLYKSEDDSSPNHWITAHDVHMIISNFLTMDISDDVLLQYNSTFNKYVPVFKKLYNCDKCLNQFSFVVDPEVSLFRQFFRR